MPPRSRGELLRDIVEEISFLDQLGSRLCPTTYREDEVLRRAVERALYVTAEATRQLREFYPDVSSQLSGVPKIVGFRHIVAHNYADLNPAFVFSIISEHLPVLRSEVSALQPLYPMT